MSLVNTTGYSWINGETVTATKLNLAAVPTVADGQTYTFGAGAAATPSINFTGGTTTGFYLGSSSIGFSVGAASIATLSATSFAMPSGKNVTIGSLASLNGCVYDSTGVSLYYNGANVAYLQPGGSHGGSLTLLNASSSNRIILLGDTGAGTFFGSMSIISGGTGNILVGGGVAGTSANNAIVMANGTAPSTTGTGGQIYVEAGALKYRGTSGTITVLGNA